MFALLMTLALQVSAPMAADIAANPRGEALFEGRAPLHGRIDGHVSELPPDVLACGNCHVVAVGAVQVGDPPDLRGGWLHRQMQRRNGPPGTYDPTKFCAALRSGIDPTGVRIPMGMPRFDISDEDCRGIWNYLESPASLRP